jgi:hypothetical protein
MKARCYNPNYKHFAHYGGRGIVVCERWIDSFDNFLADMGRRPSPMHTIDRYPNNDGNYEPGNCRWATRREQNLNRRMNRSLVIYSKALPLLEWCRIAAIDHRTVRIRLHRGWPDKEAVFGRTQ